MAYTEQCRDVSELNILCQMLLEKALIEIRSVGINPLIVETYRTQARQNYLYSVGRTVTGTKVTWTQASIHTSKNAVDLVPQRNINGKMTAIWNAGDKETKKIIETMVKYGFEAGANWAVSPDSPHFQIKNVSSSAKSYSEDNTNTYITKLIQKLLNTKMKAELIVDGKWGAKTTRAVNKFRAQQGWVEDGKVGIQTLKKLLA
ncbi:peptidoglycan-binding protein [Anaerosporobacter sp.]|uniref:peptidoglycan-binding protein n=1 Tax=Anaerosporobacter sp. TaxID=1872529 RepID=UPI00286EB69E|nr:M15 family metallopeptidase [Anaerosporobacter sp.]